MVVEVVGFDSYMVRMDGSGRISKRNRRFLRPVKPYQDMLKVAESNRERVGHYRACHDKDIVKTTRSSRDRRVQNNTKQVDSVVNAGRLRDCVREVGQSVHCTPPEAEKDHYVPPVTSGDAVLVPGEQSVHTTVHTSGSGDQLLTDGQVTPCAGQGNGFTPSSVECSGSRANGKDSATTEDDNTGLRTVHQSTPSVVIINDDAVSRPKSTRSAKRPSYLQVGDPLDPRFNRTRRT